LKNSESRSHSSGYWKSYNETTIGSRYVKKTRIKEALVLVISINLKELPGLMKASRKKWWLLGNYLTF
jgi:hypothetical protein